MLLTTAMIMAALVRTNMHSEIPKFPFLGSGEGLIGVRFGRVAVTSVRQWATLADYCSTAQLLTASEYILDSFLRMSFHTTNLIPAR
jgi:hypothetical protein